MVCNAISMEYDCALAQQLLSEHATLWHTYKLFKFIGGHSGLWRGPAPARFCSVLGNALPVAVDGNNVLQRLFYL